MRALQNTIKFIFSAQRKDVDDRINTAHHSIVCNHVNNLGWSYRELDGVFDGIPEKSIVVVAHHTQADKAEAMVRSICKEYLQECYLKVDQDFNAYFCTDGTQDKAGVFTSVSQAEAIGKDHSYDPITDTYWVVK